MADVFPALGCRAFVAAFLGFFFAQTAKVFTHYYVERKWDLTRLVGSGGMPSSHTSSVMGVTTAVGVLCGTDSAVFAMCVVFSLIVMYDATGVRLHAGKQASVLNMIIMELPPEHPVAANATQLKDTLGHTPLQVAVGAVVGIVTGYIVGLLYL
ncbi:PAP2 family protein [Helicosporidium sp. ATCC 50920]|nr:PAP2 family protein [Helicosporidium sp. ATCC 50920]|eukprot:KDD75107.1 PAP2 family protein [Helicosporidium sp. ATCC 50920]